MAARVKFGKLTKIPRQTGELAVVEKPSLPRSTGRELALPQDRQLAIPDKGGKQITVKKGGTAVVVNEKGSYGESKPSSAGGSQSSDGSSKGGGRLVRVADAIAAGADPAVIESKVLSWGNRRVRQKLADGGTIQRRAGGAGYGGTGSGGQIPPGKGRGMLNQKTGQPLKDQRTTEERLRDIRERDLAARKSSGEKNPKPLALKDARAQMRLEDKKTLALEDTKKPLLLGDGKTVTKAPTEKPLAKPDRTALDKTTAKMGLTPDNATAPAAPKIDPGTVQRAKKAIESVFDDVNAEGAKLAKLSPAKQREINARKDRDVRAALKKFQFAKAADLLLTKYSAWATPEDFDLVADAASKK